MSQYVTRRSNCRLCNSANLLLVLPMQPSPIADAFVDASHRHEVQPVIPLDLYQCQACGHAQNLDIVNPDLLFRDYIFTTSSSAGLVDHFRRYAEDVVRDFKTLPESLAVEIGSNDGTLLRFFKDHGLRVLGVDPAREIAQTATRSGIQTIPDFFTADVAVQIRAAHGAAKIVAANNVYAHADHLGDVTAGIAAMLAEDGVFVFEVSYLLDIIDKFVFDTIYHEHLSYHSIQPLARFFDAHELHLFDVQRIASKGGSIRGFVQRKNGARSERPAVQSMMDEESRRGLHRPEIFHDYEKRILARKRAVLEFVAMARRQGRSVVGYGASTTATTLMYHFELFDKLDYLVDDNSKKHGLYSPGCHLEVKPSSVLYDHAPDVVVILAWQYAAPIVSKHARYTAQGGQFVLPLIELKVIDAGREVVA